MQEDESKAEFRMLKNDLKLWKESWEITYYCKESYKNSSSAIFNIKCY